MTFTKIGYRIGFYTSGFGALGFGEEGGVLGFGSVKKILVSVTEILTFRVDDLRVSWHRYGSGDLGVGSWMRNWRMGRQREDEHRYVRALHLLNLFEQGLASHGHTKAT